MNYCKCKGKHPIRLRAIYFLIIIAKILMMKTFVSACSLALLLILGTITSCTQNKPQDPCLAKSCKNGGSCVMGTCECPTGFRGDSCEINNRDRVLGVYNVVDNYGGGTCKAGAYIVTIEISSLGSNYVLIKNINGLGVDLFGTVSNSNFKTINIPAQVFGSNSFNGYISIESGNITGSFRLNRDSPSGLCEGTLTRKP